MSEPDRSSDPLAELLASAIEAEQQTGHREETVPAAERHLVMRIVRVTLGAVIVCIGLSVMVLPGPGLIVTAAGLALMAPDTSRSPGRWLQAVRRRLPEGENGSVAAWVIVASTFTFLCSVGGSIWWTFIR